MLFDKNIENIVNRLIRGEDYRQEIVNAIDSEFMDFTIGFFKKITMAKMESTSINLEWYKKNFIEDTALPSDDIAIYSGTNRKTITNIYGSAKKEIVIDATMRNFNYISSLLATLEDDINSNIVITIKIIYNDVLVELDLKESLIVINAIATKKIALRGGAWSKIGKQLEKPLMIALCKRCGVSEMYWDDSIFRKDETKDFDRETDFLFLKDDKIYKVEVKLMGKGNPESADAVIARGSTIFVADTLSVQNKKQLAHQGIYFLELKNNKNVIQDFTVILDNIGIPASSRVSLFHFV